MTRETLRSVDAAWLQMDRPVNTADVVAVLRLEGSLSMSALRRTLEKRLLVHRRFRQRIVREALGRPAWEDDPQFSLERHLVHHRIAGEPGALAAYVGAVASDPLDLRHPPWRIHLVHVRGGSAIVAKLHHCIADGFALVAVLLSLAGEPITRERPRRQRGLRAAREPRSLPVTLLTPAILAAALGRMIALPPDPPTALKRPLVGERRVAWSRPFPRRPMRAAARARGVTVSDMLSAVLAGALRRWLLESGEGEPPRDLRALVPVSLRPAGSVETLGNEFGLVFLELPVTARTPDERIERLHARMQALKASNDALVTYGVLWLLGRLPAAIEQRINAFFTAKASLVLTSVPGPRRALHLAGRRIEHVMFWVPHPASLGLGVSILTYAGEVVVGVRADAAVMKDPARLVRLFEAELRAVVPEIPGPPPVRRRAARRSPPARTRIARMPRPSGMPPASQARAT